MSLRNKTGLAVLLRAFLLLFCWGSVVTPLTLNCWDYASSLSLSFPYQSNVFVMLLTIIYLGLGFRTRITGGTHVPRALQIARFAVVVPVTITFLYYWVAVLPVLSQVERSTLSPLLQYVVVPMLFITDFLFFDRGDPMNIKDAVWALTFPIWFSLFSFVRVVLYPYIYYSHRSHYVYSFLDLDTYGWFGKGMGIGVLWWLLIIFGLFLAIGYLYRLIQLKTIKPEQEEMTNA